MSWSRLSSSPLGLKAQKRYALEDYRLYHNWPHVQRLFWHAEHTLKLDYDEDLDKATIAHDVIYDKFGQNEIRSAEWLAENDPAASQISLRMIHDTDGHAPRQDDNRIILMDLMDFSFPELTVPNLDLIRREACQIYDITPDAFHQASVEFLTGLNDRLCDAAIQKAPEPDRPHFLGIRIGVRQAIDLSKSAMQ